jgi:hypothetical protein
MWFESVGICDYDICRRSLLKKVEAELTRAFVSIKHERRVPMDSTLVRKGGGRICP